MLYKRGRTWWVQFKRNGKRLRLSTGETDSRRARVEAARLQAADYATPGPARSGRAPSLTALSSADIREAEDRDLSPGQIGALYSMWRAVLAHFGAQATLLDIRRDTLIRYEGARRKQGIRGQTIRKEIAAIKRAFARARRGGYREPEPEWPRVRSDPPHSSRTGRLVDPGALSAFLREMPAIVRDEWRFAALTGIREAELHRVAWSWVSRISGVWVLSLPPSSTKTRKPRMVALVPDALDILRARKHLPVAFPRERWQNRRAIRSAAKRAGLDTTPTLRDLRTTWATEALAATGDAAAVQASMGHSDLRTTQLYQRSTIARAFAVAKAVHKRMRK